MGNLGAQLGDSQINIEAYEPSQLALEPDSKQFSFGSGTDLDKVYEQTKSQVSVLYLLANRNC